MKPDKSQPQKFSIRKRLASFRYAWQGLHHAFVQEHNFRIHLIAAILAISAGFYFHLGFARWVMLIFTIGFVLVAELFNSAIEQLADVVSPGENKTIGKIKDIAAGAVLISAILSVVIGILIFWEPVKTACGH